MVPIQWVYGNSSVSFVANPANPGNKLFKQTKYYAER
jgi:hypothetical protein